MRVAVAIVITIALAFVLPPSVNLNHFRARLSDSLSRSLGLQVNLEDVRLRLLPLPGFMFRHLRISEDDEFGAEPILQTAEDYGDHSTATLRWASLWRGRFEVASISLTQASLNLSRAPDGHWNLERLITRAAQVPSAPTSKKKPETRTRFPYIELTDSRINFKFGPEKKPFTLSDAEFSLWLAAENRWNVRLKAVPLRTDENISDTGVIRISGSFDRAAQFSETPFHFQVNWERPEVNAIARIARGQDPGWRGAVELRAELKGTPADFSARTNTSIDEFRRYDIARSSPLDLRVSCDHRFRAHVPETSASDQLDFRCKLPLESGTLTAQGQLHPLGKSPEFSIRLFASEVPVSSFVRALLHAKSTLPDDLTAQGVINGGWLIEGQPGTPVRWAGALTARNAVLLSQVLEEPLAFPHAVTVNFDAFKLASSRPFRKGNRTSQTLAREFTLSRNAGATGQPARSQAVIQPFTLDLGGEVQVSAVFDPEGYHLTVNGPVDWNRLLQATRLIGLRSPAKDLKGSGIVNAEYSGEWRHFAPPTVSGQAQIRSAVLSLRGFREPLRVSDGTLKFDGPEFRAEKINGSFAQSGLEFVGDFAGSRQCERHMICDLTFSLVMDEVSDTALLQLVNAPSGFTLPFLTSGHPFEAKWLLEMPSTGRIAVQRLTFHNIQTNDVAAQLEVSGGKVRIHDWSSDMFGGRNTGELVFDFSGPQPAIIASGLLQRARMDQVNTAFDDDIGTGTLDLKYRLAMSGQTFDRLISSLKGSGQFAWYDGAIRNTPDETKDTLLTFKTWSGRFELDRQRIAFHNSKMTFASGIREVAGDISFNRQWNLRFIATNGSGLVAAAGVTPPVVPKQAPKLTETR